MRWLALALILGLVLLSTATSTGDELDRLEEEDELNRVENPEAEAKDENDKDAPNEEEQAEVEDSEFDSAVSDESDSPSEEESADSEVSEVDPETAAKLDAEELEDPSQEVQDPNPGWFRRRRRRRRRRSRRRRRRRRRRGWSLRRRIRWGRRRRNIFTGRRRKFFTRRYWRRGGIFNPFFRGCRRASYSKGGSTGGGKPLSSCINSNNLQHQAKCWAPRIYLAIGETYKPSSVAFFLRHVRMVRVKKFFLGIPFFSTVQENPNIYNLKRGAKSYFLKSKTRIKTPSSTVGFFHGQNPSVVPIYTLWRQFTSGGATYRDFVYWAFYPYNRGKNVCIGGAKWGRCFGKCLLMGNHVGDWEHVTVRLRNNRPHQMYIGAHNFGGVYNWNARLKTFVKGSEQVKFTHGGHPLVFSSLGSHGHWTYANKIVYKTIKNGEKLIDKASKGTAWDTWKKLELIHYRKNGNYNGKHTWLRFLGRWGDRKRGCAILETVSGECRLNSGPSSPNTKGVMTSTTLSK